MPLHVTHRLEYAVRALVALARANGPLTAEQIAVSEQVPRLYLLVILRDLATAGVLESRRGRRGGFQLVRDPEKLTIAEISDVLERHRPPHTSGSHVTFARYPAVWAKARDAAWGVLASVAIADLV